ncbi:carbon-nitrogen hydrolase family protein [Shewanella schlegeliana]|uniref:Carbon-nitrogen hydrolase family protein n=1 Tax=Shewanella schlegeliana TaxID=190308 RepID=A0ABS1T0Q0_9GAMM|nr:carbon-nitrogen hydrolase family protein [Shewanella schlegeliana]MBL4913412.1 carbon-nitrogen hydrolase family protein [Shewanella schlegeliana]MCL1108302.1 carbon-nitrogen hydrolase family protein [Shewanella schlegeliana]
MKKVAIIQQAPKVLDKEGTINKAVEIIRAVSAQGAELIVFPEAFIPGYPAWIWRLRPGNDWSLCEALHVRLLHNSVDLASSDLKPLLDVAKEENVTVVCGVNERDHLNSQSTIYNSAITIDNTGKIANHHRKLMPTNPERMVWGFGDGYGLNVIDTPVGKIGSLICWENYMPLARYALYSQGIEIYIAPTYDSGEAWIGTMQHIAREGKCWVLCCGVALERKDLPADFPNIDTLYPADEEWINPGDSFIVSPSGEIVAGPLSKQKGNIILDIDVEKAASSKRALDVAGHYSRPDVFRLEVDRSRQSPTHFNSKPEEE